MPATLAPAPSDAPVGQQKKGAASAGSAPVPFARASKWHIEQSNTQSGIAFNSASQQTFNYPLASYGFLSAVLLTVTVTGGTGTAAVYFEDAPWSCISNITLQDVNGVPIIQLPGFSAYLAAKYGGYRLFPPDGYAASASSQSAILGGSVNNISEAAPYVFIMPNTGNFKFLLPLYLEFGVGGLGCLPNMDASARYNLQVTFAAAIQTAAATGPVFTTAPTGGTLVAAVLIEVLCRSQPPATDMYGNQNAVAPPAVGTVQYWSSQTVSGLANGANTVQLSRVGNIIRSHIFIWRNGSNNPPRTWAETGASTIPGTSSPGTADVPSVFEYDWDVGQRYVANIQTLRWIMGYAVFGFDNPFGVLVIPNTTDPDKIAISEYGDEWIATVGASKLTMRFTTGTGGGTLTVLTNDIVPASAQVYQAPSMLVM